MAAEVITSFRHLLAHGQERPKASRCLHVDQVSVATSAAGCLLGSSRGNSARWSQDFSHSRASVYRTWGVLLLFSFLFLPPCTYFVVRCICNKMHRPQGEPGWLSPLSGRLWIPALVTISRFMDRVPRWAPALGGSLLEILSLPLPLPFSLPLSQNNFF